MEINEKLEANRVFIFPKILFPKCQLNTKPIILLLPKKVTIKFPFTHNPRIRFQIN